MFENSKKDQKDISGKSKKVISKTCNEYTNIDLDHNRSFKNLKLYNIDKYQNMSLDYKFTYVYIKLYVNFVCAVYIYFSRIWPQYWYIY